MSTNFTKQLEHPKPVEGVFFQLMTFPTGRKRFLRVSRGAERLLGHTEAEFMGEPDKFYQRIYPEDLEVFTAKELESQTTICMFDFNFRYVLPENNIIWLNIKSIPFKTDGGDYIWTGLFSDINDIKLQESNLVKINHELAVLNAINDVILSCNESDKLLSLVCETLVSKGGYKLAWMTNLSSINVQESTIEPIVSAGEIDYIKEISISFSDSGQTSKGPTVSALLNKQTIITNNVQRSDIFVPWRDTAVNYGMNSTIAIPFSVNSVPYVLNVYATQVDAFNDHEKDILERVCNNLAQAITRINEEAQRKEYYALLQERVRELSVLSEVSNVLRSENSIDSALSKIAFFIADGMFDIEDTSVVFNYNGKEIGSKDPFQMDKMYEKDITLHGKGCLSLIVYLQSSEYKKSGLVNEKIVVLNSILKKIQLYIDNHLTLYHLNYSQSNLRSVFENTDVGYLLLNLNGDIITFNRQVSRELYKLFNLKIAEGMNLAEDVLKFRAATFISHFLSAKINLKSSEYESYYEYKGKPKFFVVSVFPVLSDAKECLSVCLTLKDVTKSKLAEMESKQITNDLIIRNRDLEQFSFMISHNLRAPVVNLAGLTQQLKDNLPEEEKEFVIDSILSSTSRIEGVIDDINKILTVNKRAEDSKTKINMVHLLDQLQSYFIEVNKGQSPVFQVDVKEVEHLDSNKAYIESVFYNLISNAVKFAKPESPANISIWTVRRKDKVMIHFKDDGIGIDLEKHQHNVFKLYNRFHNHVEGKGMGLYMTKTQIRLLGGDIEVRSSPNKGTEFIITLPVG